MKNPAAPTPSASRRHFLEKCTAQALALGGVSYGLLGSVRPVQAQENLLRWANLAPGFTTVVTEYMIEKKIDRKHKLSLGKPTGYTSVTSYYNDFVVGNYDVCIGTWDTFAARYLAGVPLQFVCSITTASMISIIVPAGGARTIRELQGKTLAAPQSTGTYRMTRATIKELIGFDIESEIKVQNVDNPAASVTLVMANRADAGLSWEPNITVGLNRVPDMKVLYNVGQEYRAKLGRDLPFFGIAIRKEAAARDPDLARRLDQAFAECLAGITGNIDEAVAIAGANSGTPGPLLKLAITSGRLQFKHVSMGDDEGRDSIKKAGEFLVRNKLLPRSIDDGFFAI